MVNCNLAKFNDNDNTFIAVTSKPASGGNLAIY